MAKNLVIVESPAKAKTITKFLGKNFEVKASMWHIVDLPDKELWIDIDNNFKPTYEVSTDKKKIVTELKKSVKLAEKIWLATDEDREWEAIAWHISNILKLPKDSPRIVFHEITKSAIEEAVNNPRTIDINLVDAQQWRRVLDRLVWFKTSPVLWKKIKRWLSAGRVQSVAVKLVIEKEREIQAFIPEESWKIKTTLEYKNSTFEISLDKIWWKSSKLLTIKDVEKTLKDLWLNIKQFKKTKDSKTDWDAYTLTQTIDFKLEDIAKKDTKRNPSPPFITSTLQQQASQKLWRWVKQVMSVAQKLYENWHITYMRTDSVNLSGLAINASKKFIEKEFGKEYSKTRQYKWKSANAQEAHEAIRPTYIEKTPIKSWLNDKELKLYTLIWNRTVASQMSEALIESTTYQFSPCTTQNQIWTAKWDVIKFDWFLRLYKSDDDETELEWSQKLPDIKKWSVLPSTNIWCYQQFTRPPARYTEASLVKKLESEWIWRPSTYAPTISTIQQRWYINKDGKYLIPTDIAFLVNDYLEKYFKNMMDYKFTAKMEEDLDNIALGNIKWNKMIWDFYKSYEKDLKNADKWDTPIVKVWKKCPECWWDLIYKFSSTGKFIWCSNYPDCKFTDQSKEEKDMLATLREKFEWKPCPEWWTIVVKIWRFGPFLTSSEYPKVKWISSIPDDKMEQLEQDHWWIICNKCWKWVMHVKKYKRKYFLACNKYPDCKNTKNLK